jgi:ubiquinone/menaquinone biosynthesis C-methylase UbiE
VGVDVASDAVADGRRLFPGLDLRVGDMTALAFATASFGTVVCLEGLEHVTTGQAIAAVQEFHRVLRPRGRLLCTLPLESGYVVHNPHHLARYDRVAARALIRAAPWQRTATELRPVAGIPVMWIMTVKGP